MKSKKTILTIITVFAVLAITNAQPVFDNDVDDAPIPGIVIAVIAGLLVGGRKLFKNK